MKNGKTLLLLCLFLAAATACRAQYYDVEVLPVCWDSAGVKTDLFAVNLEIIGINQTSFQYYIDHDGDKVVPGTGTVYDRPCSDYVTEISPTIIHFESALTSGYTIPADTYDIVEICNVGISTQTFFIDGANTWRMLPGECYHFHSTLDPVTNEWRLNPEITISAGLLSENNLRVYLQAK